MEHAEAKAKAKGSKTGKRFEIKKWNAVAMWSWAICTGAAPVFSLSPGSVSLFCLWNLYRRDTKSFAMLGVASELCGSLLALHTAAFNFPLKSFAPFSALGHSYLESRYSLFFAGCLPAYVPACCITSIAGCNCAPRTTPGTRHARAAAAARQKNCE